LVYQHGKVAVIEEYYLKLAENIIGRMDLDYRISSVYDKEQVMLFNLMKCYAQN
jgi:hypothetical protein